MATLEIKNLYASTDGKTLLRGLTLTIATGEIHALMGHNGAGKSTLVQVLMGNPKYQVTKGDILFDKKSILKLSPDERAKLGIFLGFQYPVEVPGVSISNFLRAAYSRLKLGEKSTLGVLEFKQKLAPLLASFGVSDDYAVRYLNSGFSGGEKKLGEILQLAVLRPKIALLDEPDSGLDMDALRKISRQLSRLAPELGILLITHYARILSYVKPTHVHVMAGGRIVKSGGHELAEKIEKDGYSGFNSANAKGGITLNQE